MGDNMSKRLKLISATEAEMEERCFSNPYPDWDQGVLTSNSGADVDYSEPFDAEGKVCLFDLAAFLKIISGVLMETSDGLLCRSC